MTTLTPREVVAQLIEQARSEAYASKTIVTSDEVTLIFGRLLLQHAAGMCRELGADTLSTEYCAMLLEKFAEGLKS